MMRVFKLYQFSDGFEEIDKFLKTQKLSKLTHEEREKSKCLPVYYSKLRHI